MSHISEEQWNEYHTNGYVRLGHLLTPEELRALQERIDDIMLGRAAPAAYERMLMQLDSNTGQYEDAGSQTTGFKGASLQYRKIQDLEHDPLFLKFLQHPAFREFCDVIYGPHQAISVFRAMFMNKPANKGTFLPWHQDRWTFLSEDPLVTAWTALDPATRENGCVQVVPGSHKVGLINPSHGSGFLTPAQAAEWAPAERVVFVEAEPGETIMMHNHLLHASDVNRSSQSRRAFSVCYMPAHVRTESGQTFTVVFGDDSTDQADRAEVTAAPAAR